MRGWGYEPFDLAEGHHPTRSDLDRAAPRHPVVLHHRTRHACVLNSAALRRLGLGERAPEPPGVLFERDLPSGELTGVVLGEAEAILRRIPEHSSPEIERAAAETAQRLLSWGVTGFHDATATNSPADFESLRRLQTSGRLRQRVAFMADARRLDEWTNAGLGFGSGDELLRVGHAKVILDEVEGAVRPASRELLELVRQAYRRGFPVALHCATVETAEAALQALEAARTLRPQALRVPDRLEHGSLLPPALDPRLRRLRVGVVSNPAFIWHSGARYRKQLSRAQRGILYRVATLRRAGVPVAAGSDAPVAPPDPRTALHVALTRRDATGAALGLRERMAPSQALALLTSAAQALSPFSDSPLSDRVIWNRDPLRGPASDLMHTRVLRVEMDSRTVWDAQAGAPPPIR